MCFNCFGGGGTGEVSLNPPNPSIKPASQQDPVRTYPRHNGSPRKLQDQSGKDAKMITNDPTNDKKDHSKTTTTVREKINSDGSSYSKQLQQQQQQLHRNRESINDASLSHTDAPNSKSETSKVSPVELTASREQGDPLPNKEKSNKNGQAPKGELIPSNQLTPLEGKGVRNRDINDSSLPHTDTPNSKNETSRVSSEELTAYRDQGAPFPNNEKSNKNAQAPKASAKVELIPSTDLKQLTTLEGKGVATAHQNIKAETSKLSPKERTRDSL